MIDSARARIQPAAELWGLGTREATDILMSRYGRDTAVAVIGPAGEAGTRYANVLTCRSFPLPRLGFGTILGSRTSRPSSVYRVRPPNPWIRPQSRP